MSDLIASLGNDSADFMSHPGRNCRPVEGATPQQIAFMADLFFPPEAGEQEATKLCRGCPIATQCASWAVPQSDLVGIFGGTTTRDRARLRKRKAA